MHNILRWVILILLLIALVQSFTKNNSVKKVSLWLLISAHITLILGLFQYFNSETVGFHLVENMGGFGNVMKDGFARFWVVEHITAMIAAIILITMARGKTKKENYNAAKWLYLIALVLIMAAVPWPFREAIARPWL